MPKENNRARQVKEPSEIGGASLIARDQTARVLEPGEQAFHFPPALVPAERAAILGEIHPIAAVRCDQFNVDRRQGDIEPVAVVGRIADDARRVVGKKAGV